MSKGYYKSTYAELALISPTLLAIGDIGLVVTTSDETDFYRWDGSQWQKTDTNPRLTLIGNLNAGGYNITNINDLTVTGNFTVEGTQFIAEVEEVLIEDNTLVVNYGETGAGVTSGSAGIQVDRGSETDYQFVFNESDDSFKIGEIGSLQSVATREDTPTDDAISYWDGTTSKFKTDSNIYTDGTNIGIGTASPSANLHVIGESGNSVVMSLATGDADGTDDALFKIFGLGNDENDVNIEMLSIGYDQSGPNWEFRNRSKGTGSNRDFTFVNDTTELLRIKHSGKVGLGTTSPSGNLHIYDSSAGGANPSADADNLVVEGADNPGINILSENTSNCNIIFGDGDDSATAMVQYDHSNDILNIGGLNSGVELALITGASNEAMRIDSSGKVGLGTTSPDGNLHVFSGDSSQTANTSADELILENGSDTGISILSGSNNMGSILFGDSVSPASGRIVYDHLIDKFKFYNNDNLTYTVDTSGNMAVKGGLTINDGAGLPTNLEVLETVTVGISGDYTTLNDAIDYFTDKYQPYFKSGSVSGKYAKINILSGTTIAEQILIENGTDLSWIWIESQDATVTIDRSALVNSPWWSSLRYPFFGAYNNSILPTINCLFQMDTSGTSTNRDGILLYNNSSINVTDSNGIQQAGGDGIRIFHGSNGICPGADFSNAITNGAYLSNSTLIIGDGDLSNAGNTGALLSYNSHLYASGVDASGCTADGIYAYWNSFVEASSATVAGAGGFGVTLQQGSMGNLQGIVATSTTNISIDIRRGCIANAGSSNCSSSASYEYYNRYGSYININGAIGATRTYNTLNAYNSSGAITN